MTATQTSPPTRTLTTPKARTSAGDKHGSSQMGRGTHVTVAAAAEPAVDQYAGALHEPAVGGDLRPPAPAKAEASPMESAPGLVDPLLILAAQALDDLEATRIANENRVRSMIQVFGLGPLAPQVQEAQGLVEGLKALEHQAELALKRAIRRHPLYPWVDFTIGVGEKQAARLLAAIGDPYIRPEIHRADGSVEPARPRLVSELWAYCGYHVLRTGPTTHGTQPGDVSANQLRAGGDTGQGARDAHGRSVGVAPARARGQRANWNADAKSRTWLIACSCIKQANSPYRHIYEEGRARYADAIHQIECRRCGPTGHPAATGTPLSAGHQHARALRLVSKEILRDLWIEARRIHQENQP